MINFLYKIGGYNPQIIKAGKLGPKYILPGLSLFIVFLTSSYGGWHLADTITGGWYRFLFTVGFVVLILLVDFLLLLGEKSKWTASLRVILSITMGFIISLLTTLVIFKNDIISINNTNIENQTKLEINDYKREIVYWKSLINDSIPKYDNLSTEAHKGDYVTPEGKKVPACGGIELEQSYCRTFARKRDNFQAIYDENKSKITNEENFVKVKKEGIIKRNPNAIIGQIENLWKAMDNNVVLMGVILFFVFLMIIDLMPISVKFGIKDNLDKDYEARKKELEEEIDSDGNVRWYNSSKEKFFIESQKEKAKIETESLKEFEKSTRIKSNISKLEEAKKEYSNRKLQSLIDKIKEWGTASQPNNSDQKADEGNIENIEDKDD